MDQNNICRDLYLELLKNALTGAIYDESAWRVITPKQARLSKLQIVPLLKNAFLKYLGHKSKLIVQRNAFDMQAREQGLDWPGISYTMIGSRRMENIKNCVIDIIDQNVPGDLIETGVWRGGATIYMRAILKAYGVTNKTVWLADSFRGLPPPVDTQDGFDLSNDTFLQCSLEQVKKNFERFGLLDAQVQFIQGWFNESLPKAPVQKLSLLRLDGDLYSSTMDALKNLYPKVSQGGYVIVDDYYSWPGCRRAVDEFTHANKVTAKIQKIDAHGVFWKV
jgi:O-methyltransferase